MKKIITDKIYNDVGRIVEGMVVVVDDDGIIRSIDHLNDHDTSTVAYFEGLLIPGLINTHCHLELSHMKGVVDTGTGLISFITDVVSKRDMDPAYIKQCIQDADQEMYDNGIVAVGDISNAVDTFEVKETSSLLYYNFIEFFDFLQDDDAERTYKQYKKVYDVFSRSKRQFSSCVPHAPYSVSKQLFSRINQVNLDHTCTVSIHNQEIKDENDLFINGSGGFPGFYNKFGISLASFEPTGQPSFHYAIQHMDPSKKSLFVHNTQTTSSDIQEIHAWSDQVYFATCPNANLYIEGQLPDYASFIENKAKMTIGTDSLTSNWQLSILEEIKTIQRFHSYISTETLLGWATSNGAEALGLSDRFGSIELGKKCGLNVIQGLDDHGKLTKDTRIHKIA